MSQREQWMLELERWILDGGPATFSEWLEIQEKKDRAKTEWYQAAYRERVR